MRIYFSGISGTGIGPLAELAKDAGEDVVGSDLAPGAISPELEERQIEVHYGEQNGDFLRQKHSEAAIDWFVYTSALPEDHPELLLAQELGIRCSKRDEFLANFVRQRQLKMIAVAGTHGKTTTVAMLIWAMQQLGYAVNYAVGTTLGWAPSAHYISEAEYFVYEADEYDRNFLTYYPDLAVITSVDYDHPDIYPTAENYQAAFRQFESQSKDVVKNTTLDERITLVGELRRQDGSQVLEVLRKLGADEEDAIDAINRFPGAGRRFEEICPGVYSDYGHHPAEIRATVAMAAELKQRDSYAGLAVIYEPHQNTRQHEVYAEYRDAFVDADKVFWLPTYLTRENPALEVLPPEFFIEKLENRTAAEAVVTDEAFAQKLHQLRAEGWLIVLMTAGPADGWLRRVFAS
ncbi:hypothetical protein IJ102_00135 [Candidatus Saccharibacteria bacterium]|nr:hypothetical protein [Candidatus Saccharibacteria bacterium]